MIFWAFYPSLILTLGTCRCSGMLGNLAEDHGKPGRRMGEHGEQAITRTLSFIRSPLCLEFFLPGR